jgi:hypothetical protein
MLADAAHGGQCEHKSGDVRVDRSITVSGIEILVPQ